ncbi:MAG TPA: chlorite dismutase family protein [Nitrososphaerales archaeon]|nr:chlorite dismutase family protein [Nitrososphaerales archaeon]
MEDNPTTQVDSLKAAEEPRFLKYTFFKVTREWRSLSQAEKDSARDELAALLTKDTANLTLQLFSLVGIRGDADFMILAESNHLESFQDLVSAMLATSLGRYLETPYSYLAMTRRSHYLGSHKHPGQEGTEGEEGRPRLSKYLFVYPFVKKREWYGLPFTERQRIMAEHFKVGHKYPEIKINTGYSFGLDDQEFVLAFEGDDPAEFLRLVEELRGTEASKYTELETPIFTCVRTDARRLAKVIG